MLLSVKNLSTHFNVGRGQIARAVDGVSFDLEQGKTLALVSLDFLNLGVPSPAPSLGELLAQGKNNLHAIWILLPTFITLSLTITLLTFVGEGIRNAFDPRKTLS